MISTGPYALVRHPMYTGGLIMLYGIPLALAFVVGNAGESTYDCRGHMEAS